MLFDFQCSQCNHTFEELVNKDEANPVCPQCQGTTEKLLCAPQKHDTTISDRFERFVKRYPGMEKFRG